ncbi:hypothetical protein [Cryobacterium zongtaii]|nr:hypothetical protein [Cryobacterium zongtaii]
MTKTATVNASDTCQTRRASSSLRSRECSFCSAGAPLVRPYPFGP